MHQMYQLFQICTPAKRRGNVRDIEKLTFDIEYGTLTDRLCREFQTTPLPCCVCFAIHLHLEPILPKNVNVLDRK